MVISSLRYEASNDFSPFDLFIPCGPSMTMQPSWWCLELFIDTQYAGIPLDQRDLASSHATTYNWRHNRRNYTTGGNGPQASHMMPCAPCRCAIWMGDNPQASKYNFSGSWGCVWPLKCSFVLAMMHCHNIRVFWGPYTPSTPPKIISAWLGGCGPSIQRVGAECKASCGVLGGHFCQWQPWLAIFVLVVLGLEAKVRSTYCRNSYIVHRSIFPIPM